MLKSRQYENEEYVTLILIPDVLQTPEADIGSLVEGHPQLKEP